MKALVTGGAGFIGSHTVDLLLARGYEVRILDNLQPRVHPRGKPPWVPKEAEFIQGDVANPADLARALQGVDYVFHRSAEPFDPSTALRQSSGQGSGHRYAQDRLTAEAWRASSPPWG